MVKNIREVFFQYCLPGVALVLAGSLAARPDFSHLGVALLSLGLAHYGQAKGYRRMWLVAWIILCVIYLVLGIGELVLSLKKIV